ncbi:hypothetical protein C2S51_017066 [Perilla frutescens var. frutescens]|nr:hypothetical protein C2S51_017066 [Perilla frutescens var. frutescens]
MEVLPLTRNEITQNRMLANDELYIAPNENPGMILTTDLFDGKNFHSWCRAVKRALFARNKLGFIDGSVIEPNQNSIDHRQWIKADYLVFNWLCNSIIKELSRADDIKVDMEEERLMQFLMGLNDVSEPIKQQILILNPLPNVSQAYAMVLQVDEQLQVSSQYSEGIEQSALYLNQRVPPKKDGFRRKLTKEEKSKLKCDHCGKTGHMISDCFEINGVPDWYRKFKDDKGKNRVNLTTHKIHAAVMCLLKVQACKNLTQKLVK